MDPISAGLGVVGTVITTIGGLIAEYKRQGRIDEANAILDEARKKYGDVKIDEIPITALSSEMSKVSTDKALRDAQLSALAKMKQVSETGFTDEDRAALNKVQNDTAQAESNARRQTLENMQARGIAGSGAELAAQLAGGQGAADRANQAGLDIAAAAQKRAYEAIRAQANMAGEARSQDFNEGSTKARSADEMARFNQNFGMDATKYNNEQRVAQQDRGWRMANQQAGLITSQAEDTAQATAGYAKGVGDAFSTYGRDRAKQQASTTDDDEG